MQASGLLRTVQGAFARGAGRLTQWPAASAFGLLGLLFGAYLYTNSYNSLYYDAGGYWHYAGRFWSSGQFRFQSFDSILRGYLFPLLLSPLTRIASGWGVEPIALTRAVGLGTAAALFGVVAPGLWQALSAHPARPVSLGRRLVFGLLGFGFWRGYFNFPLTDFPALLLLLGGLWMLVRGGEPAAAGGAGRGGGGKSAARLPGSRAVPVAARVRRGHRHSQLGPRTGVWGGSGPGDGPATAHQSGAFCGKQPSRAPINPLARP